MQSNMLEAKNQLPKLVQTALVGEEVVVANKGVPVVRMVKVGAQDSTRKPGACALPKAKADWDSPATNAEITTTL